MRAANTQLQGNAASLASLQAAAARDPKAAVKEAAKQFEAMFMQELLKTMRQGTKGGMFDNAGSELGTELLDQQYASQMSGQAGGLSDIIARQLERQLGTVSAATIGSAAGTQTRAVQLDPRSTPGTAKASPGAERFVHNHTSDAKAAEAATGIPAAFILGQAAHESGWGRREIMNRDGSTSHNLFGIKAGGNWKGKVAEITTTEYIDGRAQKVTAKFRAYDSYEAAFKDYAGLLKNSPRYANVVANADTAQEFATGLQRAGYATDPAYATKLSRVINMTLRMQRGTA